MAELSKAREIASYGITSGFKNFIINGGFEVWQRGEVIEFNGEINKYSTDRMFVNGYGFNGAISHIIDDDKFLNGVCEFTVDGIVDPDGTKWVGIGQPIEDFHVKLTNKTMTLSMWLKASEDTTVDFSFGHDNRTEITITTTWQKFNFSRTYGVVDSGDRAKNFFGIRQEDDSYSGTIYLAEMQLEEGSVATPFEQRPYGLELSLCQRYYEFGGDNPTDRYNGLRVNTSVVATGSQFDVQQYFTVKKRTIPTLTLIDNDGTAGKVGLENVDGSVIANEVPDTITLYDYGFILKHDLATPSASGIRCGWVADAEI